VGFGSVSVSDDPARRSFYDCSSDGKLDGEGGPLTGNGFEVERVAVEADDLVGGGEAETVGRGAGREVLGETAEGLREAGDILGHEAGAFVRTASATVRAVGSRQR